MYIYLYMYIFITLYIIWLLLSLELLSHLGSLWSVTEGFKGLSHGNALSLLRACLESVSYSNTRESNCFLAAEM